MRRKLRPRMKIQDKANDKEKDRNLGCHGRSRTITPPSTTCSTEELQCEQFQLDHRFFSSSVYNIGGHIYSLFDIEHRMIRGVLSPMSLSEFKDKVGKPRWKRTDPRREFVNQWWDPRINFAICHGTVSCGGVHVFDHPARIEETLELATQEFMSRQVKIQLFMRAKSSLQSSAFQRLWLRPPRLFEAYKFDFGKTDQGIMEWILAYLPL